MRSRSPQAFTMLELMVVVSVIGIVSSLVFTGVYNYLQEQHLRQAANEMVSYLLSARARALRDANVSGKACEVQLNAATNTLQPTGATSNICNDSPALASVNLLAAGGGSDLTITSNQGSSANLITFTRLGTVASTNLSSGSLLSYPRIFYFSNSATQVQRCVMVDLNSFRIGWRNSSSIPLCTYNAY